MTPREGVDVCDMRACPFCHEADFDAVGLKVHLSSGHCDAYESTPSPARTVRLGSSLPAVMVREEVWKAMVAYIECEDAYKNASKPNDWMAPLTAAGWDGKSNPRPLINRLRTRALALARSTGGDVNA